MRTLLLEVFSVLSRLLNVLTGGTADMTFSARSHRDGLWTEPVIDWIFLKLFREQDHCRRWWEIEVERSKATLALAIERDVNEWDRL